MQCGQWPWTLNWILWITIFSGNEASNHHLDNDDEGEAAEGVLQHSGAMTDFFINPVVPVYRQGKRTTRLLPKAKRQKLEMIMARQMQGEDIMNISDDRLGTFLYSWIHLYVLYRRDSLVLSKAFSKYNCFGETCKGSLKIEIHNVFVCTFCISYSCTV